MAITILEKRKFQRNLILVFVAVCAITGFILWKGLSSGGKKPSSPQVLETVKPREVKINFDILKSPLLKDFRGFEDISPLDSSVKVGRENPFLSY